MALGGSVLLILVAGCGQSKSNPPGTVVTVVAGKPSEYAFSLSTMSVPHGAVTFKVANNGLVNHTFKVCRSPRGGTKNDCAGPFDPARSTGVIFPGSVRFITIDFMQPGTYEFLCGLLGHAKLGMKGDLQVT
jgi:uncharacterized cupredoxin-like copper-binding protein